MAHLSHLLSETPLSKIVLDWSIEQQMILLGIIATICICIGIAIKVIYETCKIKKGKFYKFIVTIILNLCGVCALFVLILVTAFAFDYLKLFK